jgi:GNAT superfamily N-acetyltransferase
MIKIQTSDTATVAQLMRQLPEFHAPYREVDLRDRLAGVPHLILIALMDGELAGFKLGYERLGHFYSWLGGVLPAFRRQGIACALAEEQERWAREQGYEAVIFKTRNQHKAMLVFALKNGFDITGFEARDSAAEHRIWLRKNL